MTKTNILATAILLIIAEALLPIPGPLTLLALYVLLAKPLWFKTAIALLYQT